jgi:putative colanic acid biosynthesis acetyltransferase WcaF
MKSRVRNDQFDATRGLDRGRSSIVEAVWYLVKWVFFLSAFPWPSPLRCRLLRVFGATVGAGVYIKPRVNVHFPWKLTIGDHAWIGEEAFFLNFEPVAIGPHACISQRTFLCTGNHDYRDPTMPYRNRPIEIGAGAWIGAQCFVGPGVHVGVDAVATAGSVVVKNLPAGMVCSGNPCVAVNPRWRGGSK